TTVIERRRSPLNTHPRAAHAGTAIAVVLATSARAHAGPWRGPTTARTIVVGRIDWRILRIVIGAQEVGRHGVVRPVLQRCAGAPFQRDALLRTVTGLPILVVVPPVRI